ncbi:MAG: hypothetical protein CSA82_02410, partial [Actinobacteria bacterium]
MSVKIMKSKIIHKALRPLWQKLVPQDIRRFLYHRRHFGKDVAVTKALASGGATGGSAVKKQAIGYGRTSGPLLSVVVPVYKVEDYLDEAVSSIVKQTYQNLEIILVDDGSPDRCGEMCEAWAKKDQRIRVLHKPNGGLSDARNAGMAIARGEFIAFVDSDDTVDQRAYERLMGVLLRTGSDVATGNVKRFTSIRTWQGWNQSYSHRRDYYPELGPKAPLAERVKFVDHPELLFDTTCWNKVYKMSVFQDNDIEFPVGKLYEDMFPVSRFYAVARSIDVVFDSVYNYREREDESSITQKRGDIQNFADKMEMLNNIYQLLEGSENAEVLRDTLRFKLFEGDLPVYAPYLGRDPEFDRIYMDTLERYWPETSPEVLARCSLARRVLLAWQARGEVEKAAEAEAWVNRYFFDIPVIEDAEGLRADLSVNEEMLRPLIEDGLDDMSRYAELRSTITDAQIKDGRLYVEGYAFIDAVPESSEQQMSFELRASNGAVIRLDHTRREDERANDTWGTSVVNHRHCGFLIDEPLAEIMPPLPRKNPSAVKWELWVSVTTPLQHKAHALTNVWRGGKIRLGDVAVSDSKWLGHIDWSLWNSPLTFVQRPITHVCDEVTSTNASISASIRALDDETLPSEVRFYRDHDKCVIPAVVEETEEGKLVASMSMSRVPGRDKPKGARNGWHIEMKDKKGHWRSLPAVPGLVRQRKDEGWSLRGDSSGMLCFVDDFSSLVVDSMSFQDSAWILKGHCPLDVDPSSTVLMWSNAGAEEECKLYIPEPGRFVIIIDLLKEGWYSENLLAWRTGEYHFWLKVDDQDSKYRIRASASLVEETLQINGWEGKIHSRFHIAADSYDITMRVGAGLTYEERGRYNQKRMQLEWQSLSDEEVEPLDAVVFASFMEANACDSSLAIFEELKKRDLKLDYYWAVADGAVVVPDGAIPLLRGSAKFYEVLSRARYLVNNVGGIDGYGDRSFQYQMQTWHGTPLKHVGRSLIEEDPRQEASGVLRGSVEGSMWDFLISPNPFFSSIAHRDMFFD